MQRIASQMQRAVWRNEVRGAILSVMINKMILGVLGLSVFAVPNFIREYEVPPTIAVPEYTSDGQMKLPEHYREWIYLSTGFDMVYSKTEMEMGHHMFDNVFVNPEAYRVFVATGTWPDKTMFVLETRRAEGPGSINQKGNYQGSDKGIAMHVKDTRFSGGWAFFGFGEAKTAKMIPTTAACYTCHSEHAAVDTTFVQFYPTLLPIAKIKGTLSVGYVKETATPAQE